MNQVMSQHLYTHIGKSADRSYAAACTASYYMGIS